MSRPVVVLESDPEHVVLGKPVPVGGGMVKPGKSGGTGEDLAARRVVLP